MQVIKQFKERGVLKLGVTIIVLIAPEVLSYYAVKINVLPLIFLRFIIVLGIVLISTYASPKLFNRPNPTRQALTLCFALMLFTSLFNVTSTMPILTLLSIGYIMLIGVYGKYIKLETLNSALCLSSLVFIPAIAYQLTHANLDMASLLRRGYTWSEIFYYTVLTNSWAAFLISSVIRKKNLIPALLLWLCAVILNLISLKKSIFISTTIVFMLLMYYFYKCKDIKSFRYFLWIGVPLVLLAVLYVSKSSISGDVSDIFSAVGNRFEDTSDEGLANNNRATESIYYFSNEANLFDIIMGKGWLSSHHALEEEHYYLHIGWTNLIFKGGLILFFVVLLSYRKVFKILKNPIKYSKEQCFSALFCMYYFFTFFYGNNMGFGIDLFLFFYSLTMLNGKNGKSIFPQTVC